MMLTTLIKMADIAAAIKPQKILLVGYVELQVHLKALAGEGFFLPGSSAATVTARFAVIQLISGNTVTWLGAISFWKTIQDDDDDAGWNYASPCLADLMTELEDEEGEESENETECDDKVAHVTKAQLAVDILDAFHKSVFNDTTLAHFQTLNKSKGPLIDMARAFLDDAEEIRNFQNKYVDNEMYKPFVEALDYMFKVFRALIALASPRPGWYDATSSDVDFFMAPPKRRRNGKCVPSDETTFPDISVHVKSFVQVMKEEDGAWTKLKLDYKEHLATSKMKQDLYETTERDLAKLAGESGDGPPTPLPEEQLEEKQAGMLKSAVEAMPVLRTALRQGACDHLDVMLVKVLRDAALQVSSSDSLADADKVQKLRAIKDKVHVVPSQFSAGLLQEVTDSTVAFSHASRSKQIASAANLGFKTIRDAHLLHTALMANKGVALEGDVCERLEEAREHLWKLTASVLDPESSPAVDISDIKVLIDAMRLIATFDTVRNVVADVGGKDVQGQVPAIAESIVDVRSSLERFDSVAASNSSSDMSASLNILLQATEKLSKIISAERSLPGCARTWVDKMLEHGQLLVGKASKDLAVHGGLQVKHVALTVQSTAEKLDTCAGGGKGGQSWREGANDFTWDQLLTLADQTIKKSKGAAIDSLMSQLQEVSRGLARRRLLVFNQARRLMALGGSLQPYLALKRLLRSLALRKEIAPSTDATFLTDHTAIRGVYENLRD